MTGRPIYPIIEGDGDERHGTTNGYGNHRCRCAECTEAWKLAFRISRAAPRPELQPGDDRHGTNSGYQYWKCRCVLCRAANATRQRESVARRSAK